VNPGDKILNVGSQSGMEALVMAKIIGPQGKLFVFEPYSFSNTLVS
jgi:tRNA A58 N-methylase Trm61